MKQNLATEKPSTFSMTDLLYANFFPIPLIAPFGGGYGVQQLNEAYGIEKNSSV